MNTPGVAAAPNTQLRENFMTTHYHSARSRQVGRKVDSEGGGGEVEGPVVWQAGKWMYK